MSRKSLSLSAAFLFAVSFVFAAGSPDTRIAVQLDRMGEKYTTTKAGNYSLEMDMDGGRTQTVYLMSKTETYNDMEIREIWSNAGSWEEKPSAELLMDLLTDNNTEKMGAWSIESSDDGSYLLYYSIKVPAYIQDKDLKAIIEFAATVADEKEAKVFEVDDN
jgi:hypothetical protein